MASSVVTYRSPTRDTDTVATSNLSRSFLTVYWKESSPANTPSGVYSTEDDVNDVVPRCGWVTPVTLSVFGVTVFSSPRSESLLSTGIDFYGELKGIVTASSTATGLSDADNRSGAS